MKNIMTLEEFLSQDRNISEINEGLLSNLFGAIFRRDMWSAVKGEESIKKEFREIDNKLDGFYLTKIKNPNASQNVRQTLVDWAGDIYNAKVKAKDDLDKMDEFKKEKESLESLLAVMSVRAENEKELEGKISEETKKMLSKLKTALAANKEKSKIVSKMDEEVKKTDDKYQKELDDLTSSSPDLKRWANILKNRMSGIIDKVLAGKYDEENKLAKDLEKLQKEKDEKMKKKNLDEVKNETENLKEIDKNRKELFKKCDIQITNNKTAKDFLTNFVKVVGDEKLYESFEIQNLKGKTKITESAVDFFEKNLGIKLVDKDKDRGGVYAAIFCFNRDVLPDIDDKSKFSGFDKMSGESMHALTVAFCNILFYASNRANVNKGDMSDDMKKFIAHCAMSANADIGFGLPFTKATENLPEPKENEEDKRVGMLNYFIGKTRETLEKSNEEKPISNEMDKIIKDVYEIAKEIVKENKLKNEKEAKEEQNKEEQEEKKEENK